MDKERMSSISNLKNATLKTASQLAGLAFLSASIVSLISGVSAQEQPCQTYGNTTFELTDPTCYPQNTTQKYYKLGAADRTDPFPYFNDIGAVTTNNNGSSFFLPNNTINHNYDALAKCIKNSTIHLIEYIFPCEKVPSSFAELDGCHISCIAEAKTQR